MRALEVLHATGKSITVFRSAQKKERDFNIKKIGLEMSMTQLTERINLRVDQMMEKGLLDEVKSVLPYRNKPALQTVGYKEIFDYLEGNCTLPDAIQQIKVHTRQYAKRQMTWFKKDPDVRWENALIKS
jgi:tRNA dimethylallyltransferase